MRTLFCFIVLVLATLTLRAQETNALKTDIENFEAQTNALMVKGYGPVGTVTIGSGTVTVRAKETVDIGHGQKLYGIVFELGGEGQRFVSVLDEDELEPLTNALDYLSKITYDVTPLASFTADYKTKNGMRFVAHSARRQGGIQYFLQFEDASRMAVTTDQLSQLANLVNQAREIINGLKRPK